MLLFSSLLAKRIFWAISLALLCLSLFFRFYAINVPNFFVFDEGYYLMFNYKFVHALSTHLPTSFLQFWQAFGTLIKVSLGTGKPIWFVLVDGRAFWGAGDHWAYPRLVSAVAGFLTLIATYFFAKKFSGSKSTALVTTVILSILPSHMFYSRLALQEAVSGVFFITGFYFYLFPRNFGLRTAVSALLLFFAYLSNYRLIIIPGIIALMEIYQYFTDKEKIGAQELLRKFVWFSLMFASGVLFAGIADKAQNMNLIFAWSFYQSTLAVKHDEPLNFLSYPYYLFALESILLGLLFFGNVLFLRLKDWKKAFPFLLALLMMIIFSITSDRAARYICVVLPFISLAVAILIVYLYDQQKNFIPQWLIVIVTVLLVVSLLPKTIMIATARSDYQSSIEFLNTVDPGAKILSTQSWTQILFAKHPDDIFPAPTGYRRLVDEYRKGYRYLIIDPQAYISYTQNGEKFNLQLKGCLGLVDRKMTPAKVFPHFNATILERVVFEHNENLWQSIMFLRHNAQHLGSLRIYAIKPYIDAVLRSQNKVSTIQTINDKDFVSE